MLPLSAMILSAGLGTRLRPLTDATPKPLVWIGDKPALSHVLSSMASLGARTMVINSFYNALKLSKFVEGSGLACRISEEETLLGTAGGIARARDREFFLPDEHVLVWNGDILSDLDSRGLVLAHASHDVFATLAVRARPAGEGSVGFDEAGQVVRLRQTRRGEGGREAHGGDFLGVSILSPSCRESLPKEGCLVGDAWIPALLTGARLQVWQTDASTEDIGSIDAYAEANFRWLARRGSDSYVGPGAEASGIFGSVVGANAKIRGSVRNSIVWPDVVADGPFDSVIVGPAFQVPIRHRS